MTTAVPFGALLLHQCCILPGRDQREIGSPRVTSTIQARGSRESPVAAPCRAPQRRRAFLRAVPRTVAAPSRLQVRKYVFIRTDRQDSLLLRPVLFGGVGILLVMPSYIHAVVLRLKDDATAEQKASIVEGLRALPAQIPQIQTYRVGLDLGLDPSGCHIGIVGTFESPRDYDVYAKHEAHVGLITTQIKPAIAKRAAIQFTRVRLADPPRRHPGGTTPPALTHCVLLKLKEDVTSEQREDILQGLSIMPSMISHIQAYRIGPDAGQDPAKFDIAIVGDFNSVEDYKAYAGDAAHIDVITSKIKPFLEERVAVQFSATDSPSDGPAAKRSKDAHEHGDEAAGGSGAGD